MKKRLLLSGLVALLSIPAFVGCDSSTTSSNSITSNPNDGIVTEKAKINEMLTKLRKGFTLEGEINQTRHILDGYYGDPTGVKETVLFDAEFIFEKAEENGYSAIVTSKEGDNEPELIINNQVFEGKDGYAYFYDLFYDNTVQKYQIYDMETGTGVNFGYYCLNPFDYLIAEDFSKVEGKENTYTLTKSKSAFFAANVFGQVDYAFCKVIDSFELVLDGSDLKSIVVKPELHHSQYTDFENFSAVYYFGENVATFEIKNVGSASKVKRPQPKETKEEHANLQEALNKYKDNFTINLEIWYEDEDGENFWENHLWYYYDGESLYFSATEDQSFHDSVNNMYFTSSKPGGLLAPLNEFTYEEVTPKIDEVDAAIFNYNAETNTYSICDEMVTYFPAIAMVPPFSTITLFLDGYSTYFDITLTETNDIEKIEFGYFYPNIQYNDIGHSTMTFSNVGTTKIPHGLKSYE